MQATPHKSSHCRADGGDAFANTAKLELYSGHSQIRAEFYVGCDFPLTHDSLFTANLLLSCHHMSVHVTLPSTAIPMPLQSFLARIAHNGQGVGKVRPMSAITLKKAIPIL